MADGQLISGTGAVLDTAERPGCSHFVPIARTRMLLSPVSTSILPLKYHISNLSISNCHINTHVCCTKSHKLFLSLVHNSSILSFYIQALLAVDI